MGELIFQPVYKLAEAIRRKQVSSVEAVEAHLAQIARHNPALNAIATLDEEGARRRAQEADAALARGESWGPLHGVPVTLKDVWDTAGMRSTMGTASLGDRIPMEDSIVSARMKAAGAVLLGKTNAEFAPLENPFGHTRNPWDLGRTPGCSSSGAAAALAAGLTSLDVGSDAGGSITTPANWCGIFGMRPTERRVPFGSFPTDPGSIWRGIVLVPGPMARTAKDLRLGLQIISGPHPYDSDVPPLAWREVSKPAWRDLRIAWTPTFPGLPAATDIRTAIEELAGELGQLGGHVERRLPDLDFARQAQLLERLFQLIIDAFGESPTTLADYFTALHERDWFIGRWEQFFEDWDVLLCPEGTRTPFRLSELDEPSVAGYFSTSVSPSTGCPSAVIPLSRDRDGLPFGVQAVGRRWDDERLLAIAGLLAEMTGGFQRPPGY